MSLAGETLVVACSGGPDSASALALLRRVAPRAKLVACYVNHQMRPAARIKRDIATVRAQARAAKARAIVERVVVNDRSGSPEERARVARYDALAKVAQRCGAGFIVTGHQQNDVAETALLALVRGSGIDGVAAMRPLSKLTPEIMLVRPLLWAQKHECSALVRALRLRTSEDETNSDTRMRRNALRAMLRTLEKAVPGAARGVARSAALLADDKALLDRLTAAAWRRAQAAPGSADLSAQSLRSFPLPILRRVIRHAVKTIAGTLRNFSFEHCDAIAAAIKQRRGGRYHAGPATVVLSAGLFSVQPSWQQPVRFAPIAIDIAKRAQDIVTELGTLSVRTHSSAAAALRTREDPTRLLLGMRALRTSSNVELRLPQTGDTCIPSGRNRPVSLARFLAKAGVPASRRARTLLLCAQGRVAAALGVRVMEPFAPGLRGPVLELCWRLADT